MDFGNSFMAHSPPLFWLHRKLQGQRITDQNLRSKIVMKSTSLKKMSSWIKQNTTVGDESNEREGTLVSFGRQQPGMLEVDG